MRTPTKPAQPKADTAAVYAKKSEELRHLVADFQGEDNCQRQTALVSKIMKARRELQQLKLV